MRIKAIALGALIAAGVCATATAAPPEPSTAAGPGIGFTATTIGDTAIITLDAGAIELHDDVLTLETAGHRELARAEMSFRVDDFTFPIAAEITGRTATLTPLLDREHAVYSPVALPFEDSAGFQTPYQRETAAWNRLIGTVGLGVSMGALVGGLGGAAVGCVLGGIAGATVAAGTIVGLFGPFLPAAVAGCLGGIVAVGALGTVAGQLLVAAPVAVLAAVQYFATISAPM
ncbi:hypothetical protein [Nocardia yamanashiensis]|uniref:hypothetical protein n=1 Tax=Nocardia yamanashiensis TaxID=209247 RepID=UPI00082E382E|nr:hypothetical protein [Nocardia yamanashiensis]